MNLSGLNPADIREILELALDRNLEYFDMNTHFYETYGLDSMGAVVFFVELQRRTGIKVEQEEAVSLYTGQSVLDFVLSRGGALA